MANLVRRIIDSCTIKTDGDWKVGRIIGRNIRIAGILPPTSAQELPEQIRKMEEVLIGKEVSISKSFYVETGPTLVAEIRIEGVKLEELFSDRQCPPPPRSRIFDSDDIRDIRRVEGLRRHVWTNPLRNVPLLQQPALINIPFPTDNWSPNYKQQLSRAQHIYSPARASLAEDEKAVSDFLQARTERVLILFGQCGWGKSWFVRNYLATHTPDDMEVGYIDAIEFPHGESFSHRLQIRLAEILREFVNNRTGGLMLALKPILEKEVKGIFPGSTFDDPNVHNWCQSYLEDLAKPGNIEIYNSLRLNAYEYSSKQLLLVVDNIDGFGEAEQSTLFDQVIESIAAPHGVYVIIPLRPSSKHFTERLSTTMQNLHRAHWLSKASLKSILQKRTQLSVSGESIAAFKPEQSLTMTDILNIYLNSEPARLLEDMAQGDARHYIRLFRRLLYSNELHDFSNIGRDYYAIDALMLKPGEAFSEESSFILNCFDNLKPDQPGNALIRWRVLEYFLGGGQKCGGVDFDYYFLRLGYNLETVQEVLMLWEKAGAIEIYKNHKGRYGQITACGRRYRSMISNLWYCIAVKTGMYIDSTYILRGNEAKVEAQKLYIPLEATTEWVKDEGFISFLADEEAMEELRFIYFASKSTSREESFRGIGPKSISRELWFDFMYQQRLWEKKRRRPEA